MTDPGRLTDESLDRDHAIGEVARLAGVSSRTLRHYDAIGLLAPKATSADGRRWYGRGELLRLQRILVLRELGLSLEAIARICDENEDEVTALQSHLALLREDYERLTAVITTVEHTLEQLEEERPMTTRDVFAGLPGYDDGQQRAYEAEAVQRWGQDAVDASRARTAGLSPDQARQVMADHEDLARALGRLRAEGAPVDGAEAQDLVARHHAWVSTFWTPNAEAYRGLAALYVDDERFRRTYDAHGEGTAQFLQRAIEVYAQNALD